MYASDSEDDHENSVSTNDDAEVDFIDDSSDNDYYDSDNQPDLESGLILRT